jgi:hypothetical protein
MTNCGDLRLDGTERQALNVLQVGTGEVSEERKEVMKKVSFNSSSTLSSYLH